jgi:ribonuclease G
VQPSILFTEQLHEQIAQLASQYGRGLRLHLHPYIYAYVSKGIWSEKMQWLIRYGIHIIENQSLGMLETRFLNQKGEALTIPMTDEPNNKASEKQN